MSNTVFLFKEKEIEDRDCVRYIELDMLKKNHLCIDGKFNVCGACYSMSLKDNIKYENITTILTKEEYKMLCNPNGKDLTNIIKKLESTENEELFKRVQEEEKEYLMEEYGLDESDVEQIFNEYSLDYKDRGVVGCIFNDTYVLGYEEAFSCGYISDNNTTKKYFDFEQFGEDLLEDEYYIQLKDGRVVALNY